MKKEIEPMFDTMPISDSSHGRDPKSKVAKPSDMAVQQAKEWVDENRL